MAADGSDLLYKLLVVGEAGCGKTSLVRRYVNRVFADNYRVTVGVDFHLKTIEQPNGDRITLQLWDVAGVERYGQMMRVYFHGAVGAVVICDAQRPETLQLAGKWKEEIDSKVWLDEGGTRLPCLLIVNKIDLGEEVSRETVQSFVEEHGFTAAHYVSAKTGEGVEEAFEDTVETVERLGDAVRPADDVSTVIKVRLNYPSKPTGGGMCKC